MDIYGLSTREFEVVEFKFKSDSEHTINGEHYDLEMQIYFRGNEKGATVGPR